MGIALNILIALCIIAFPLLMMFYPPKSVNSLYGYRTPRSMKSLKNWNFAQKTSGTVLLVPSIFIVILQILLVFFLKLHIVLVVTLGIWIFVLLTTLFITEQRLKRFEKKTMITKLKE